MSPVFLFVYNHYIVIIIIYPNTMLQLTIKCVICKKCLHFIKCGILLAFVHTREVGVSSRNVISHTFPNFSQSMLTPMRITEYPELCMSLQKNPVTVKQKRKLIQKRKGSQCS